MQRSKIDKIDRALGLLFLLTVIYLFVVELSKHYGYDKIQMGDDIAIVNRMMGKPDYIEHSACNSPCEQRFVYANWFTLDSVVTR